ncbi:hypothetical protein VKT23_007691 [Stygiomarasmius scandens]|uniref:ELYS-like domain-containing protein n=1 Tax=Marasmiellus scandens TaxID=2682957 RepID=A0ABR1JKH1_9AGAR
MDVDSPYHQYFDFANSDNFPWRDPRPTEIEQRRALLSDVLLYDLLLQCGGVREPDIMYPPHDTSSLDRLLEAITTSTYDTLKKDCLVYYLLKWYMDGREARFQLDRCISPQFAKLADAYWCLDSGLNVAYAVSLLSDCRLNTDYASKILQAISSAPITDPYPSHYPLIVKYIRTAKPLLTEPQDLDTYIIALANSSSNSLFDAWQFQRTFSEEDPTRTRLLKKLLQWCVTPKPRADALGHLLTLPLTPFEKGVLHSYAASSPPKNPSQPAPAEFLSSPAVGLAIFQNLACTRLIQTGDYADAIKLHRKFMASPVGSGTFSSVAVANAISDRTSLIDSVYASLPAVERALLDMELEGAPMSTLTTTMTASGMGMGDIVMSSSWEDVRAPGPAPAVSVNGGGDSRRKSGVNGLKTSVVPSSAAPVSSSSLSNSILGNGNLGLSTSTAAPSAAPPILGSGSSVGATLTRYDGLPILPVGGTSNGASSLRKSTGISAPRKSIPGLPGPSLSSSTFNSNPLSFSTSNKNARENAFYKPLQKKVSDDEDEEESLFASGKDRASDSKSPERPESRERRKSGRHDSDDDDGGMEVDDEQKMDTADAHTPSGLDYSIFSKKGQSQDTDMTRRGYSGRRSFGGSNEADSRDKKHSEGPRPSSTSVAAANTNTMSLSTSGKLPGAFMDEDDDDDEEADSGKEMPPPPPPEPKTRQVRSRKSTVPTTSTSASASARTSRKSTSAVSASASTSARPRKSTRKSMAQKGNEDQKEQLKRSIPGSMFDDDDDMSDVQSDVHSEVASEAGEEEESVAPLRNATKRSLRKTGSGSRDLDDGAGARRRSSRLSGVSPLGDAGVKKSTRGRRKK